MFGFRDIFIIQAIVQHGGFRAASDATGVAQSAISRRVRHLEDRMKITIFERDGRGVRLTAVGRRLLEEADTLITQRDRILVRQHGVAGPQALAALVRDVERSPLNERAGFRRADRAGGEQQR